MNWTIIAGLALVMILCVTAIGMNEVIMDDSTILQELCRQGWLGAKLCV